MKKEALQLRDFLTWRGSDGRHAYGHVMGWSETHVRLKTTTGRADVPISKLRRVEDGMAVADLDRDSNAAEGWANGSAGVGVGDGDSEKKMAAGAEAVPAACKRRVERIRIHPSANCHKTCDTCDAQEDQHYCLLHSVQVKNMDTMVCDGWLERGGEA